MTSTNNNEDHKNGTTRNSIRSQSVENMSSGGPTVLFLWMWNWFVSLPKTVTSFYADLKSGELLSRVPLLDAMCQFIVAVATSCHPQEEPMNDEDCKENVSFSPSKTEVRVFQGTARTLRSRTVESK